MRHAIVPSRFLTIPILSVVLFLLALVPAKAHGDFDPTFSATLVDPAPGAPSDYTLGLSLPEGDVNFARVVTFIPPEWEVAQGEDIPIGAEVGVVRADATVGLINSPCNQVLPIEIKLRNASLDQDTTISFYDTDDSLIADFAEDSDANGIVDGIDRWPEFIDRVLDQTEAKPIRRSAGMAVVAATPILLQFLVYPPGTFIDAALPSDPALGFPTVALLQDAGDPEAIPEPGAITDFCTPLDMTATFFGITGDNIDTPNVDESGATSFTNPTDGTYAFFVAAASQRDADGDGFENSLDTCPLTPNVGNPHIAADGDIDFDGLDAACDPNDIPSNGGINSDQDGDGYLNRQDNCPLDPNGESGTNQADTDYDGIGDECDPNPSDPDTEGESVLICIDALVEVGQGGSARTGLQSAVPSCAAPVTVGPTAKGNIDCDNDIDSVDALKTLRHVAAFSVSQQPECPEIGSEFASIFGDIDCDEDVDAVDGLLILRFVAGLPVSLPVGCPEIGSVAV